MICISAIVAASKNNIIGKDGNLPWRVPEDLKFFKDKTSGHSMIMGRKTWESLTHPLPNRLNVVVTRNPDYKAEGAYVFTTIEEALEFCKTKTEEWGEEIFIIGGGEIYKQSMHLLDRIYLTRINEYFEGDASFPEFSESDFKLVEQSDREGNPSYSFLTYDRKSKS